MDKPGIYCIYFDQIDNKYYIGCSITVDKRILEHKAAFIRGNHQNRYLQSAYNKYGDPVFEILEYCDISELHLKEIAYISKFDSFYGGFNFTTGGDGGGFGEGAAGAKYSKQDYIEILWLLAYTSMPFSEISTLTNVSVHTIKHISSGLTHGYLSRDFPTEYKIILEKKNNRSNSAKYKGIKYPVLIDPKGLEYTVDNVHGFAEEHGLQYQNLHKVLTGKRKRHKGWELKI